MFHGERALDAYKSLALFIKVRLELELHIPWNIPCPAVSHGFAFGLWFYLPRRALH